MAFVSAASRSHWDIAKQKLQCNGSIDASYPSMGSCLSYSRVCFDQSTVISFDPAYNPNNISSLRLPRVDVSKLIYNYAVDYTKPFVAIEFNYEPLPYRPGGLNEATSDLRAPSFDSCIVPVIFFAMWPHNYAEAAAISLSRFDKMWRDGALPNTTLFVQATPGGVRLMPFMQPLLRPLTNLSVMTLAELSARSAVKGKHGHPGRCFQQAYICVYDRPDFGLMYDMLQHTVQWYQERQALPASDVGFDGGNDTLKVLIESRGGTYRSLINAPKLVTACNDFQGFKFSETGPWKRVQCRTTTFGVNTLQALANADAANVLVAVHGAGATNAYAMHEGSALIEIRPLEFGSRHRGWANS
ncbi:hypothetical protein C2E20_9022 [Micractinium conductrix]|uniref:Uncharacterized protein n=1 Tax=Micractinium conductrix TaxID=554055 RepID=A0A2P6UZM0_9CHLO|nr:hypothetical protein C2E20_9022 [Micractinium conductrix]|eukprot:PSC67281.1 hypothetical protein C2E20_9022 [Micractinium conductrix]